MMKKLRLYSNLLSTAHYNKPPPTIGELLSFVTAFFNLAPP